LISTLFPYTTLFRSDGKNPQNYGAHLHLALMLIRDTGVDPKQISQELQTYADSYAQWGAERQMRTLYYPPNLAALQDYMRMYGRSEEHTSELQSPYD